MVRYNFSKIENHWRRVWEKKKFYQARDFSQKPKYYCLIEFPYPSGEGLHVGHARSYTAMDIIARKRRREGFNVLYPIGWDAFGLPTENYAIRTGIHPKIATQKNTATFRRQLKRLGFSFDWSREINTTDPNYYRWTQWIFLQFYKHGLAYKKKMPINWCLNCKIGLANEEVVNGRCERCGGPIEKREKEQWLLAITKYAERLLKDLDKVDYLEKIKIQQQNWIGKSEGALIKFQILQPTPLKNKTTGQWIDSGFQIEVFTTRPDTLFGATYLVLAPEHPIIQNLESKIQNLEEVKRYIKKAKMKLDLQRIGLTKEKTGIELKGLKAFNPANKKEISIFVADYVLMSYGTGAIMAVPAHDIRDYEFAKKFRLPIIQVIKPPQFKNQKSKNKIEVYDGEGELINSGKFNGLPSEKGRWEITKFVGGEKTVQYHLRDWIFSRQHYWGEPIPLVFCEACKQRIEDSRSSISNFQFNEGELLNPGWIAVPEKDLPVKLPEVKKYQPTDTGESPLAAITNWVNTRCPKCGAPAKRETDTMPNWAGSSWYFLRYLDPKNKKTLADKRKLAYWMPVDWYNGGMEHTTLHLLYSRFWNKFLYDIGVAPVDEPYKKRTSQGMVLGEGGEKMSKSRGNVINPDKMVEKFGADAFRLYQMFMGPFDQAIAWDEKGLRGCFRFLGRIWQIAQEKKISRAAKNNLLERLLYQTIKKVSDDIETMDFNTAVSSLMILGNEFYQLEEIPKVLWEKFLLILAPFTPFITEELWQKLGHKTSIHQEPWPRVKEEQIQESTFPLIIQVNGKYRGQVQASMNIDQKSAESLALKNEKIKKILNNQKIQKVIFVKNRLINFVI